MRTITLTDEQANLLVVYILITTQYRNEMQEMYTQLATEFPSNETFRDNAEWYASTSERLEQIKNIIDEAWGGGADEND